VGHTYTYISVIIYCTNSSNKIKKLYGDSLQDRCRTIWIKSAHTINKDLMKDNPLESIKAMPLLIMIDIVARHLGS
jgi:hypothetical protein